MNILTVIACHNSDCIRAERLIDQIFALNRKEQKGHVLLVFAPSVPQENRDKVRISAEVVFKSAAIINAVFTKDIENQASVGNTHIPFVATMMFQAAEYISKNCRTPWLWLEPDSLPLKSGWMEKIVETYESQPMRYMAGHLKRLDKDGKEIFSISRMGVYPNDAVKDFEAANRLNAGVEFFVFHMSSKCRLFQNTTIEHEGDLTKLRPDAVLAHSDKRAVLVDVIVKDFNKRDSLPLGEPDWESLEKEKTEQKFYKALSVMPETQETPPPVSSEAGGAIPKRRGPKPKTPAVVVIEPPKSYISTREIPNPPAAKVAVTC